MLGQPTAIPFSAEAMKASLLRPQNEWETVSDHSGPRRGLRLSNRRFRTRRLVGAKRVGQSTVLIGRCTCEGILWSGSQNRSRPSFIVRRS